MAVQKVLSAFDYVIFAAMLLISALIGIFYAYRGRKAKHGTAGYLMANRSMGVLPVSVSLAVSFKSAVTVLGVPADVYQFGIMYAWTIVSLMLSCLIVSTVFIPTLYSLQISSVYEYLERRFSKTMRLTTTVAYLLQNLFYMGINIYGPALALSEVTGFSLAVAMLSTAVVCIFYTTLGGLKGVIWADVFQGLMTFVGMLGFIIQASIAVGGFGNMWQIARKGGRTDILVFETDPRIRYTFWSIVVGSLVLWTGLLGTNQAQVQQLLSVKSQQKAIRALCFGTFGIAVVNCLSMMCGIAIYAYYRDCDPLTKKCIRVQDQIMPYAMMDLFRNTPGLPGVYLSCAFSASLSTVSSGINSMVTVATEDFIKPHTNWTEKQYTWASKSLGILIGGIALGVSFLASVLGDIVTIGVACISTFAGPSLGIFLLGIWFPFVNSIGAGSGFVAGVVFGMTLFFGSRSIVKPNQLLRKLDVSTRYCPKDCGYMDSVNITDIEANKFDEEMFNSSYGATSNQIDVMDLSPIENFYALSYFYTVCVALAATIFFGIIISLLTCGWKHRHEVGHSLIRPPFESKIFSWLPEGIRLALRFGISWTDNQMIARNKTEQELECKPLN